jgi:hypothetical protein
LPVVVAPSNGSTIVEALRALQVMSATTICSTLCAASRYSVQSCASAPSSSADLTGKLEVLDVTCEKSGRKGRYSVARLIEAHSRDGKVTRQMPDWPD